MMKNELVPAGQSPQDLLSSRQALAEALDTADKMVRMQYLAQLVRLVHLPILLGREADPCAVGTAALIRATEGGRRCPGRGNQL